MELHDWQGFRRREGAWWAVWVAAALLGASCGTAELAELTQDEPPAMEGDSIPLPDVLRQKLSVASSGPPSTQVVYLALDGVSIVQDPNRSDAQANASFIVRYTQDFPAVDALAFGYSSRAELAQAVAERLRAIYRDYELRIVTERPASGPYTMLVVGGGNEGTVASRWSWGVAPFDKDNLNPNDIGFAFTGNPAFRKDVPTLARVLAHELGHSLGLAHLARTDSLMAPFCVCADEIFAGYATDESGYGWEPSSWQEQPAQLEDVLGRVGTRTARLSLGPDVDGDGRSDLVGFDARDGSLVVYRGAAAGALSAAVRSPGGFDSALYDGTGRWLVDTADVNGDKRADLVSVSTGGEAFVQPGRADGTFAPGIASFRGTMDSAMSDRVGHELIAVADVDGDGRADLVTAYTRDGNVYVYPGKADGTFDWGRASFRGTFDSALPDGVGHRVLEVADVNGDRRADLVSFYTRDGNVYVYPGRADGTFDWGRASFAGTMDLALGDGVGHESVGVADVDGDGRADLVTFYTRDGNVYVYPGRADGTFDWGRASFAGTMDSSLFDGVGHELAVLADIDGDRRADLVTVHSSGVAYVYRGGASGIFGETTASLAGAIASGRQGRAGVELTGEKPYARRRGCPSSGCQ